MWFVIKSTATTPRQQAQGELTLFDVATLGADAVVNVPASPALQSYCGVSIDGQANGWKVEVKTGSTVLFTLNVDNETVWLVYNGTTWRVVSHTVPEPIFEPRLTPAGCWLSAGADANLVDLSGNGRDITKSVTIVPGEGYGVGRLGTSYSGRYARASDAAFQLTGAMSYEYLAINFMNAASTGYAFQCGSGSGAANNVLWGLRIDAGSGVPRWSHRQQSGTNVSADMLGPAIPFGPAHVLVTRAAPSGGTTATKMYVNGALGNSANLTTPDQGSTSQLLWGGTSGAQAPLISQWGGVWPIELTAAQAAYIARLRLSKLGPLGA